MKAILKNVASIQSGYSFRSRLESMDSGAVAVIQMKDLTGDNRVNCDDLARIDMEIPKEHHLVRAGDLIFRSRGLTSNSALLVDDPDDAVLAAPLLRIRVTSDRIMPAYLNWFISQRPAQLYLASCSEGTSLKMISKTSLEYLEVVFPSLQRQLKIIELASLAEEEQRITNLIVEKRTQYITAKLLQIAEGE
jgi:restriction endonuclease S subunit